MSVLNFKVSLGAIFGVAIWTLGIILCLTGPHGATFVHFLGVAYVVAGGLLMGYTSLAYLDGVLWRA